MALPNPAAPSRTRLIVAAMVVALIVAGVWKVIDYRQPPPGKKSEIRIPKSETNPKD